MKKALINNRLYDVVDMQEYSKNQDLYNPRFTAIEGHGKVLPIRIEMNLELVYIIRMTELSVR